MHILDINSISILDIENIFSQLVICELTLITAPFVIKKSLILCSQFFDYINFSIFYFMFYYSFGVSFKNCFSALHHRDIFLHFLPLAL